MQQALRPLRVGTGELGHKKSGTRPDAIVFAWVLDLPAEIHAADAAKAVLDVTRHQLGFLSPYQRSVVAELAKMMRTEESTWTSIPAQKSARRYRGNRLGKGLFKRQSRPIAAAAKMKELVCLRGGRDRSDEPDN